MNYWERLNRFKLYFHQGRLKRFKCMYIWKSINRMVPSLDLEWVEASNRAGHNLKQPNLVNIIGSIKTSLNSQRVWGLKELEYSIVYLMLWGCGTEVLKFSRQTLINFWRLCQIIWEVSYWNQIALTTMKNVVTRYIWNLIMYAFLKGETQSNCWLVS